MSVLRRYLVSALALAVSCAAAPVYAQTLALPTTAPEYLRVGQSVIVRPIVRDAIGRPTTAVRVQAWSSDTTVLRVAFVSGGQRLTAVAAGTVTVTWRWQRTDGQSRTLGRTVRVTAAATVPVDTVPVVLPPVDTGPPPASTQLSVAALTISPATALQLVAGDSARLILTGARVRGEGSNAVRAATEEELAAIELRWSVFGTSASVSDAGVVRAQGVGFTLITVCADDACQNRGVSVSAPPVVEVPPVDTVPTPVALTATRWVGVPPSSTPCARPLVAGELLTVTADSAHLVRALDSLPAWIYCVADSLAVTLDGWLGDGAGLDPSVYAPGAPLPVAWPAVIEPDTTIRPVSLQIVVADSAGGAGGGAGTMVLGMLGALAVGSLLAGANAAARRGRDEEA